MPLYFLPSASACYWDPEVVFREVRSYLPICRNVEGKNGESVHHVSKSTTTSFTISGKKNYKIIAPCDCPCDDLVEVETPPRSVMALSYIAQALVVTIVGLNMGFRYARHCMCSEYFLLRMY
jgi:hypothetical protein